MLYIICFIKLGWFCIISAVSVGFVDIILTIISMVFVIVIVIFSGNWSVFFEICVINCSLIIFKLKFALDPRLYCAVIILPLVVIDIKFKLSDDILLIFILFVIKLFLIFSNLVAIVSVSVSVWYIDIFKLFTK